MLRRLTIPENSAIINAQDVAGVIQVNAQEGREDLTRALLKGSVNKYHPGQDENLLANPLSESMVTRTEVPYNDITDGTETYRVWRTGEIEPQSGAPPIREYPPIAQYLLSHRWPFPDEPNVGVVNTGNTSVSSVDVKYYTTSGATDFDVNANYIRSDETLRCIVAVESGNDTISATLEKRPSGGSNTTVDTASLSVSPSRWSVFSLDLSPSGRIPYNHDPLVLTVDAGALTYARPVLRPKRTSLAPSYFPLPDGRALVHVSAGSGWTTEAEKVSFSGEEEMITDLATGRAYVLALRWPEASKKRAVVTGEDRSQTHKIERTLSPRLWTTEKIPGAEHLPIARLSAG